MSETEMAVFRAQLLDRRAKVRAVQAGRESHDLGRLLQEIDCALGRMEQGSYGLCAVCHDPIEPHRLACDPLVTVCLDHYSDAQRRALEEDLDLALRVQAKLLPDRNFRLPGWRTSYHYEPAGPVSGDFCDLANCDGDSGRLFFAAGDVAGKGVSASLLMSHLHAILRTLVSVGVPLRELMDRANRVFCESTMASHYATMVCGIADSFGTIEIANAGHCPAIILRSGEAATVEATGIPLGLFCDGRYGTSSVRLDPGDLLVLYTDGLTEARNAAECEYGLDRLLEALANCTSRSPEAITSACLEELETFLDGAAKRDDLTILAIQRTGVS